MADRPYVVLSSCVSLDGYIDDASAERLVLSNDLDLDRVDEVRASCDAILVGANTIRRDDPRLLVRSAERRERRVASGRAASPLRVAVTRSGQLDVRSNFFAVDGGARLVYAVGPAAEPLSASLCAQAEVVALDSGATLTDVLADLIGRGVERLLVEGGATISSQLLQNELVDELHLAVAPLLVGDANAQRFVGPGDFPWSGGRRARLVDVARVGDVALLRYALTDRFGEA